MGLISGAGAYTGVPLTSASSRGTLAVVRLGYAVAMGVLLASSACRSKPAPVPPPTGPLEFDDDADGPADAPGEDPETPTPAVDAGGCKAGGEAWDGKHEGCLYEVAGCCYADAASACAAAGCSGEACQILESAPAQVVCRAE